jgi:hypothetical protein
MDTKIYILERKDTVNEGLGEIVKFVIEAKDSQEARKVANSQGHAELYHTARDYWLNPQYTTCRELKTTGKTSVIAQEANAGD